MNQSTLIRLNNDGDVLANEIEEISGGDFVLSGGEIGAQLIMDATIRLIPDVISGY